MARIRSIHPGIFTDEDFVDLSPLARLLYIGLWTESDDKGAFPWKPTALKMRILPADNANVDELLSEIEGAGFIAEYEAEGKHFGAIRNFRKFQRPRFPNDIHPMPDNYRSFVGLEAPITETDDDNVTPLRKST